MVDVDATALRAAARGSGHPVGVTDLLLFAAAQALVAFPNLNGAVIGDRVELYEGVDVGLAVETPEGLTVPVIRSAQAMPLEQLAAERERLVEAARVGRLRAGDVGSASITVSNLGKFGIRAGTPVLNLGEPILVFVGAIEDRPVAVDGAARLRPMLTLSIAFDHRLVDGVAAARYTSELRRQLETVRPTGLDHLAADQRPVEPVNPERGHLLEASCEADDGYTVRVRTRGHTIVLDEPASLGGADRGADPVATLLAALSGCLVISLKAAAKRRGVAVSRVTARTTAPLPRLTGATVSLTVWSEAPTGDVEALLVPAKRACRVGQLLRPEFDLTLNLEVRSGRPSDT
jgi:uncharacterized OsmC-like protein